MYISSITCILPFVIIVQLEMHFQLPDPKITKESIQQLLLHTCSYALACNLFQSGSERENLLLKTAIKNGQSRETGNLGYTRQRQTNVREYRRDTQKWTIQRNWQHRVHKAKKNKTKLQHNRCYTPLYVNKDK